MVLLHRHTADIGNISAIGFSDNHKGIEANSSSHGHGTKTNTHTQNRKTPERKNMFFCVLLIFDVCFVALEEVLNEPLLLWKAWLESGAE